MRSLVIGYGNDLRSDDGAGRVVADRIGDLGLPGVSVRSVSQLTPELSLEMTEVDTVVFVDANVEVSDTTVSTVTPNADSQSAMSHYSTPARLLALTATVGTPPSQVLAVSIPVADIGLGMELTPITAKSVDEAVALVTAIVTE